MAFEITIPKEAADALFNYLADRPWREVWKFQQLLMAQAEQAQAPKLEPPPKP